ncbi:phosphomevalonate kinase [Sporolactobacillus shoreicorticis]|uniref:phosphomevalonate kinase n=1 Tax=Sporolactobacillus shoreicorticis TaxID=1923877 RepID=A0ABW5RYM4_9BACL|nr:phosphomevalonate kinase [Sporolactobacillus shoreicorticis]MCO7125174.1 phosphomevalonate kinase [Sporolactobacillus shoreicorticis]
MQRVVRHAPGKLYIAGEYAVVEPGYPAIIAAVDQFVTVQIEQKKVSGRIQSVSASLNWSREAANKWKTYGDVSPFRFVLSAIKWTERYILAMEKQLDLYQLTINSDLDSKDGRKYGLGSSAAVTVACVRALLAFYDVKADQQIIFKLAALAHLNVQGNGSCGDIAASVYGGWIEYTSFDRDWLARSIQSGRNWIELLHLNWPKLSVQRLVLPQDLHLIVGWTGTPASTFRLVRQVEKVKRVKEQDYQHFLNQSKRCVEKIIDGFRKQRSAMILDGIRENRKILAQLSELCGVAIETEKLNQLCMIAESYRGAAKTSGAGGGDCGIALAYRETNRNGLTAEWQKHGIIPLALHVSDIHLEQEEG